MRIVELVKRLSYQFGNLGHVLRRKPFDISTEEGRRNERYRRVAVTTVTSVASKAVSIVVQMISVPLTIHYLGVERFGLWMTLSSLLIMIGVMDLGLGNGLLNAISRANGLDDKAQAHHAVATTFFLLCLISVVIAVVSFFLYPHVDFQALFNLREHRSISECGTATIILILIFILGLPFAVVQKLLDGYQEGYINNIFQIVGNIVALGSILFVVHQGLGLPWLVGFYSGVPLLALVVNFFYQFYYARPELRPSIRSVQKSELSMLLKVGGIFFFLNVLTVLSLQSDNLIIANILGAGAVAEYAVVQKMTLLAYVYWAYIQALWPAFGEAIARGDFDWVRKTLTRSIWISSVGGLFLGLGLLLAGQKLVHFWIGISIIPTPTLFLGFSVYILVNGIVGVAALVFNSSILLKKQIVPLLAATSVSVILKIVFADSFGLPGIVWANSIAFSLFYLLPSMYIINHFFSLKTGQNFTSMSTKVTG